MPAAETPFRIEPCHLSSVPSELADVAGALIAAASSLGARLHGDTAASLRELVAVMNCYYSNLIEGHDTRPRDIERALQQDLEDEPERRDLQLEARAHIRVQRQIDRRHDAGVLGEPAASEFIRELHRAFYEDAPERFLHIEGPSGAFDMAPGEFRREPGHDNAVGRHQPPASTVVEEFMGHFEERYRFEKLGAVSAVIATAAAHHRLNYIHPFPDGNGRVSRLVSHAMALRSGVGAGGLWSVSRGLARGLSGRGEYLRMMDAADAPRRGDLDGRGNLSEAALVEFVTWFTRVALDQVTFMASLFDLDSLAERLGDYATGELGAPDDSAQLLAEVLRRGSVPRGEVARITGRSDRGARDQLRRLTEAGLLASATPKGPVSLRFDSASAESLFPRLFPVQ